MWTHIASHENADNRIWTPLRRIAKRRDETTPCLGQQAFLISSEAIAGHNTSLDCVRTNSAVVRSLVALFRQT
jgi:hypothetical protein